MKNIIITIGIMALLGGGWLTWKALQPTLPVNAVMICNQNMLVEPKTTDGSLISQARCIMSVDYQPWEFDDKTERLVRDYLWHREKTDWTKYGAQIVNSKGHVTVQWETSDPRYSAYMELMPDMKRFWLEFISTESETAANKPRFN